MNSSNHSDEGGYIVAPIMVWYQSTFGNYLIAEDSVEAIWSNYESAIIN